MHKLLGIDVYVLLYCNEMKWENEILAHYYDIVCITLSHVFKLYNAFQPTICVQISGLYNFQNLTCFLKIKLISITFYSKVNRIDPSCPTFNSSNTDYMSSLLNHLKRREWKRNAYIQHVSPTLLHWTHSSIQYNCSWPTFCLWWLTVLTVINSGSSIIGSREFF